MNHTFNINRRTFLSSSMMAGIATLLSANNAVAKQYLTPAQAKTLLIGKEKATKVEITLTRDEAKSISRLSKARVRNRKLNAYKTTRGEWLIFDQVIGKHENIDVAFALSKEGKVKGLEILVYRETYGHQVRNKIWRKQFHGKSHHDHLKLDREIKNISGATLSCRHLTDATNRITQTWAQVLSKK